jgi:hypothetical protein
LPAAFPPVFVRIFITGFAGKILTKKNAAATGNGIKE